MKYAIVGVGSIASAIISGLCADGAGAQSIKLSPRNANRAAALAARHASVTVADSNQAAIDGADVVILALRPFDAPAVLSELSFAANQSVISVMASLSLETLKPLCAPAADISRAIPLPSVARREGVTPIFPATPAARAIFEPLGGIIELADEKALKAISIGSGTVAAHFAYLDAVAHWLEANGVQPDDAVRLVASVFAGLAPTLQGEAVDFAKLAGEHATPGGVNETFAAYLKEAGVLDAVTNGLDHIAEKLG